MVPQTGDDFNWACTFGPLRLLSNRRRGISPYSSGLLALVPDNPGKQAFRPQELDQVVNTGYGYEENVALLNIGEGYCFPDERRSQTHQFLNHAYSVINSGIHATATNLWLCNITVIIMGHRLSLTISKNSPSKYSPPGHAARIGRQ